MTSNGLVETLAISKAAEMERASPAVLVKVCSEVVVTARVSNLSYWHDGNFLTYCLVSVAYSALRACITPSIRASETVKALTIPL